MTDNDIKPMPILKQAEIRVESGKPLQFSDLADSGIPNVLPPPTSLDLAIGGAIVSYTKAARKLLEGKYATQKELAPSHLREKNNITVLRCNDGIVVRYDPCNEAKGKLVGGYLDAPLATAAPFISEQLIHFPADPKTYVPAPGGLELLFAVTDSKTGSTTVPLKARQLIYGTTHLPDGFEMPAPPARPSCFVSVYNEVDFHIQGELQPSEKSAGVIAPGAQQFITHSHFKLPVGWRAIEIYPLLGEEYWKAEYGPAWAELDLLAAIAQRNTLNSSLIALDGRGATRKQWAALLLEFENLLAGPEEPAHQFLKQHPQILCPTHERFWSKLPFGDRKSDFVFLEPYNDYLLVEIEAPIRGLIRKDGQQREELTHAINQITDWVQYIGNNKQKVEQELGLTGISTNPRTLVVIGRSASLTENDRRKIETLQAQQNKLRILTYDDLIAGARANLERILGPLGFGGQNFEFYFYKQ
jgi:hypothetical protein